jgi:hypothetical protein
MGWGVVTRDWAGGTALNHAGSNTMNLAETWVAPAKGLVFVAATNIATDAAINNALDEVFVPFTEKYAQ